MRWPLPGLPSAQEKGEKKHKCTWFLWKNVADCVVIHDNNNYGQFGVREWCSLSSALLAAACPAVPQEQPIYA